jgi:hypothetical protein
MRSLSSRRQRFTPQLESLEERQLLNGAPISASLSGSTLTVRGSQSNDNIQINDDGTHVQVFAFQPAGSSTSLGVFTNISNIVVDTRGGNDLVRYMIQGTNPLQIGQPGNVAINHNLTASLGSGNDRFEANVVATLQLPNVATTLSSLGSGSHLSMNVSGGAGDDVALFRAGIIGANSSLLFKFDGGAGNDNFTTQYGIPGVGQQANTSVRLVFTGDAGNDQAVVSVLGDLTSTSELSEDLEGGAGNDSIFSLFNQGNMDGSVDLFTDGGAGNDKIFADYEMGGFNSFGRINAVELGDGGNDDLTFIAHAHANPPSISALLNGGPGNDTAHFTGGATLKQIETAIPVP